MRYTSGVGGIRISTHFFNDHDDLDRLLAVMGRLLGRTARRHVDSRGMIALFVTLDVRPALREQLLAAITAQGAASLEREPGCLRFDVCVDRDNPNRVLLYEVYEDQAAFDAHGQDAALRGLAGGGGRVRRAPRADAHDDRRAPAARSRRPPPNIVRTRLLYGGGDAMRFVVPRGERRRRAPLRLIVPALALAALVLPALGRTAAAPTGIDVSNWQRQIDWLAAAGSGRTFVFAKATEGTTFTDVTFAVNRAGAAGVGMHVGAYHLARPTGATDAAVVASAVAQADYFVSVAQPKPGELLPVLDLEVTGNLSVARLTLWVQTWLSEVRERTGSRPIIYVSPAFWKKYMGDSPVFALAGNPLWIAHWTQAALPILPGASWGGAGWSVWQWSNCDHIPGVTGCVDGDRLNGTSFARITMPANPGGLPVRAAAPTITGGAQAGATLAALPGTWTGGKPVTFAYQWQRCDPAGKGCMPIDGAVAESYVPTAADVGHALVVSVSAAARAGTAAGVSLPTAAVASSGTTPVTAPKPKTPPSITGTTQVGQTLAAQPGTWTGTVRSFSYQWQRCATVGAACATIAGAAGPSYVLTPGEIGFTVRLVVTALGVTAAGSATTAPDGGRRGGPRTDTCDGQHDRRRRSGGGGGHAAGHRHRHLAAGCAAAGCHRHAHRQRRSPSARRHLGKSRARGAGTAPVAGRRRGTPPPLRTRFRG